MDDELEKLKAEVLYLTEELAKTRDAIRRAKDPSPVERPSFKRVIALVKDACMNLVRIKGGWLLKLGHLGRRFRCLKDIWEILLQEDWILSEIFPAPDAPPGFPRRRKSLAPAFIPGPVAPWLMTSPKIQLKT